MASVHEEYLYQEDRDAVLDIIVSDILEHGDELQQDKNLITHRPIHVLFAAKFAFQKVDSPGISALNIT